MWGKKTVVVVGDSRAHSLVNNVEGVRLKNLERYVGNGLKLKESLDHVDNVKEEGTLIDVLIFLAGITL